MSDSVNLPDGHVHGTYYPCVLAGDDLVTLDPGHTSTNEALAAANQHVGVPGLLCLVCNGKVIALYHQESSSWGFMAKYRDHFDAGLLEDARWAGPLVTPAS